MTTKQNIEKVLWNACDSFRGKIDSSRYKDYILSMLFVQYLSLAEREQELIAQLAEEKKMYNTLLLNQIYDNMKRGNLK